VSVFLTKVLPFGEELTFGKLFRRFGCVCMMLICHPDELGGLLQGPVMLTVGATVLDLLQPHDRYLEQKQ